jgi:hypothetical protein
VRRKAVRVASCFSSELLSYIFFFLKNEGKIMRFTRPLCVCSSAYPICQLLNSCTNFSEICYVVAPQSTLAVYFIKPTHCVYVYTLIVTRPGVGKTSLSLLRNDLVKHYRGNKYARKN